MNAEFIDKLIDISLNHLSESINKEQLFYNRLKEKDEVISRIASSTRYSIISLIGLYQARNYGYTVNLNLEYLTSRITANLYKIKLPDIGLLLWLSSVAVDDNLAKIVYEKLDNMLKKTSINSLMTISLAWILTGLSKSFALINEDEKVNKQLELLLTKLLKSYNSKAGLFTSFNGKKKNIFAKIIHSEIGCFADQVYSIIALSEYCKINDNQEVKSVVESATNRTISLQGNYGEWPWLFDVEKGTILEKYPIYSVHQTAMAPMALKTAGEVIGHNYGEIIEKSLEWFDKIDFDDNGFIDEEKNIIWRSIKKRGKTKSLLNHFGLNYGGITADDKKRIFKKIILNKLPLKHESIMEKLVVDYESRPYHYGWILYMFCSI